MKHGITDFLADLGHLCEVHDVAITGHVDMAGGTLRGEIVASIDLATFSGPDGLVSYDVAAERAACTRVALMEARILDGAASPGDEREYRLLKSKLRPSTDILIALEALKARR